MPCWWMPAACANALQPTTALLGCGPKEIICEFDPRDDHPDFSFAMAVIDRSEPHLHKRTTEIYRIVKGELKLHVGTYSVYIIAWDKREVLEHRGNLTEYFAKTVLTVK